MINAKPRNHSYRVPDVFGIPGNTKGEVGLEIETIGVNLPTGFSKTRLWSIHPDASVKPRPGESAVEYVFSQPVGRPKVSQALDELLEEFKEHKTTVAEGRHSTSVHVHINSQALSMQQVYTWLSVYFIFEEMLVRWAGPHRVGNLFCLRARDAQGLMKMLSRAVKDDNFSSFSSDHYRYGAVNVMALSKFGSLEFRALRGTVDKNVIKAWIEVLLAIKDKSLEYKNPSDVLADFSQRSPIGFANHILPNEMKLYMLQQPDFQDSLYEGARLVQDFAFATTWENKVAEVGAPTKSAKIPYYSSNSSVYGLTNATTWAFATETPMVTQDGTPQPSHTHSSNTAASGHTMPYHRTWVGYNTANGFKSHDDATPSIEMNLRESFIATLGHNYTVDWFDTTSGRFLYIFRTTGGSMSNRVVRKVSPSEYVVSA